MERTKPNGRVLGIDLIPAQPPRGVSTIQGNFLAPSVRQLVKDFLATSSAMQPAAKKREPKTDADADAEASDTSGMVHDVVLDSPSYLEMGQHKLSSDVLPPADKDAATVPRSRCTVDVWLSCSFLPSPLTNSRPLR